MVVGNHSTPPPTRSFRPIIHQAQHEEEDDDDDDDDEIPSLMDEDDCDDRYSYSNQRRRTLSLPTKGPHRASSAAEQQQQQQQPTKPNNTDKDYGTEQQQQQQEAKTTKADDVPFFLLDWMIDDLVPDHQSAQDLANLLQQQQESRKEPLLRKSKSCGIDFPLGSNNNNYNHSNNSNGSSSSSSKVVPILQRFLPWSIIRSRTDTIANANASTGIGNGTNSYRPVTPPTTKERGIPPMPITTPKSSNRKDCKQRRKERRESLIEPQRNSNNRNWNSNSRKGSAAAAAGGEDFLLVPRNLNDSLEDCEGSTPDPDDDDDDDDTNQAPSQETTAMPSFPKFKPRGTSSPLPPSEAPPSRILSKQGNNHTTCDSWTDHSVNNKSSPQQQKQQTATTKKSASCPQLCQERDELFREQAASQQRQRARVQHDRRERRNKLTIVQRSMTLAQGWNNKGLTMAGTATKVEQEYQHQGGCNNGLPQHQQQQQGQACPEHWWESSLECWDNALEIYRSLLGEYHERVADVQNNRGIALGKLGRFDEALLALGMALEARKKQEQRREGDHSSNNSNSPFKNPQQQQESPDVSTSAAIVSTLHNIANVFRDAGNPSEALRVLVEAQDTLKDSVGEVSCCPIYHRQHCWHQWARLSTAIGHVNFESESWRDARTAYGEALEIYEKLRRSLSRQSERLEWTEEEQKHKRHRNENENETKRLELLYHQQLVQREVSVLEKDLDELDRSQQARDGSRARLLQVRKQQHQQQKQHLKPKEQQRPQTLFGIVSSLRA